MKKRIFEASLTGSCARSVRGKFKNLFLSLSLCFVSLSLTHFFNEQPLPLCIHSLSLTHFLHQAASMSFSKLCECYVLLKGFLNPNLVSHH
jgi:hypothetical protein